VYPTTSYKLKRVIIVCLNGKSGYIEDCVLTVHGVWLMNIMHCFIDGHGFYENMVSLRLNC
jgi:hypothetical protein